MGYCIGLVEDEVALNEILCMYLKQEGFIVKSFLNGSSALKEIENEKIDLWILDIMLPDVNYHYNWHIKKVWGKVSLSEETCL